MLAIGSSRAPALLGLKNLRSRELTDLRGFVLGDGGVVGEVDVRKHQLHVQTLYQKRRLHLNTTYNTLLVTLRTS